MRGDNLLIVDLTKYNTDGKEAKYIQINHIVGKLTTNKNVTEDNIRKAEFEFFMDLKTLISKAVIDPELTGVRISMRARGQRIDPVRLPSSLQQPLSRMGPHIRRRPYRHPDRS